MKVFQPLSISAVMSMLALCGCVDSNYDLSDIDTNVQFAVNDLTVPIKIDEITLSSIISDDKLEIIDGAYAYTRSGDFTTSSLSVPKVVIPAKATDPIVLGLSLPGGIVIEGLKDIPPITLPLPTKMTGYTFHATNVTEDLTALYSAECECDITVTIEVKGIDVQAEYTFADVVLQLPENITDCTVSTGVYNKDNSTIVLNTSTKDRKVILDCHCSTVGFGKDGIDLVQTGHSIDLEGEVGLKGGNLTMKLADITSVKLPESVSLSINYSLGDINIKSIDGAINKAIDDVTVPRIDITDLPDVLSQPGTNLLLANPCLYMSVNNPLSICNAYAEAGFDITSYHGEQGSTYTIDNPTFRIAAKPTDYLCFSPVMPSNPDAAYPGCTHVPFKQLGDILSGDGIPDALQVMLTDPRLPQQRVTGFMLGHDYGQIQGTYKFVAPLQFGSGTHIVYTDRIDGWGEDVQKMTVTRLEVPLTVTTDVPVKVELTGYPIDDRGNRIGNVSITGATVDANAQGQQLKLSITGTVTGLDGIEFEANASAVDGAALSPSMKINLSNIRPCVSGYYATEL